MLQTSTNHQCERDLSEGDALTLETPIVTNIKILFTILVQYNTYRL